MTPAEERALYRERAHLVALLASTWPAVLRIDPTSPPPAAAVLYLTTPRGQLSWHIAANDLDLFGHVDAADPDQPDPWDGHSTAAKYQRIRDLTALLATEEGPPIHEHDQQSA